MQNWAYRYKYVTRSNFKKIIYYYKRNIFMMRCDFIIYDKNTKAIVNLQKERTTLTNVIVYRIYCEYLYQRSR